MKKNLCKTLVMMLVMSSITLTVKATDLSDLFEVGKIYTIHEVGEIIKPYDDHIWAEFFDTTSLTIVFRFCSNYDDQGLLWWYNFGYESYCLSLKKVDSQSQQLCGSITQRKENFITTV